MHPSVPVLIAILAGLAAFKVLCQLCFQRVIHPKGVRGVRARKRELHGIADMLSAWTAALAALTSIYFYMFRFMPWVERRYGHAAVWLVLLLSTAAMFALAFWAEAMERKERDAE